MSAGSATIDFFSLGDRSVDCVDLLVFLAVLFFFLWSEGGGDLAVEGGEVGFELLQLVLFAPLLGYDGFKLGYVGFEFGGAFLVLDDYAGDFLQCVERSSCRQHGCRSWR